MAGRYQGRGGLQRPCTTMRRAPNRRTRRGSLSSSSADHRPSRRLSPPRPPCLSTSSSSSNRGSRGQTPALEVTRAAAAVFASTSRARLPPARRPPKPTPMATPLAPPCRIKTIKQQTAASKPRSKNCRQKEKRERERERETRKGDEEEAKRACFQHKLAWAGHHPLQLAPPPSARRACPPANSESACSAGLRSPTAAHSCAPSSCRVSSSTPTAERRSSSLGRRHHCFD